MNDGDNTSRSVDTLIGTKLGGQYTVTSLIGTGGMGSVYRAHQDMMDRDVAIKFLPQELTEDENNVQRLAREAKALGRLSHPNIVTTYDFGFSDKKEPYLVLELVDGGSLDKELKTLGYIPFGASVPIFLQLADAMKYAHTNGVVHRDLKPHNIMIIRKDGKTTAKILDFGIAQLESETQKLTRVGEIWGSPYYMSPEQCSGEEVDHRSDIYSLGVVMYRTLSGQLPHKGDNFTDTVNKKLTQPAPFFAMLKLPESQAVPQDLEEIVMKCLRRKPSERFQSMAELKDALTVFEKAHALDLPTVPPSGRGKGKLGGNSGKYHNSGVHKQGGDPSRLILPLVAIIAVVTVAALGLFLGMTLQSRKDKVAPVVTDSKPTAKPAVSPEVKEVGTYAAGEVPGIHAVPVPLVPTDESKKKSEDSIAKQKLSAKKIKLDPSLLDSPNVQKVEVERVDTRVERPGPVKRVIKAIKNAVAEHREKTEQRRAEKAAKRAQQAEAKSDPAARDSSGSDSSIYKPRYRPNDSNEFYRRFGGARD